MSVSKLIKHKTLTEGDISHVIQMAWLWKCVHPCFIH